MNKKNKILITLRKESLTFYKTILEHKISTDLASISRSIFNCSSTAFYKKLNYLEKSGLIEITNRNNGLITLKIKNDNGIKLNQRNKTIKPFVKLTKKQSLVFKKIKNCSMDLNNFNPTLFCKQNNLCTKTILDTLYALDKNGAITFKKIRTGFYSICLLDIKLINDKDQDTLGKIYLIQNIKTNNLKIGFTSKDIEYRIKQLQTGNENKLELLYIIDGSFKAESLIHKKFQDFRLEGEWFQFNQEIMNYFSNLYSNQEK